MTSKPVGPSTERSKSQAEASLSQSTPATERIFDFCSESGSPISGNKVRQPPLDSEGGKYLVKAGASGSWARAEKRKKKPSHPATSPHENRMAHSRVTTTTSKNQGCQAGTVNGLPLSLGPNRRRNGPAFSAQVCAS